MGLSKILRKVPQLKWSQWIKSISINCRSSLLCLISGHGAIPMQKQMLPLSHLKRFSEQVPASSLLETLYIPHRLSFLLWILTLKIKTMSAWELSWVPSALRVDRICGLSENALGRSLESLAASCSPEVCVQLPFMSHKLCHPEHRSTWPSPSNGLMVSPGGKWLHS